MTEDVIVTQIQVNRKDDQQYFQVVLPRDTVCIKGIESSARISSQLAVNAEKFLGTVQLQSEGHTNLCYCTDIFIDQPEAKVMTSGFGLQDVWIHEAFIHSNAKETDVLHIPMCHVLYGCYKDIIGQKLGTDLEYIVTLFIWIERIDKF